MPQTKVVCSLSHSVQWTQRARHSVCMCVCRERDRERERDRHRETHREIHTLMNMWKLTSFFIKSLYRSTALLWREQNSPYADLSCSPISPSNCTHTPLSRHHGCMHRNISEEFTETRRQRCQCRESGDRGRGVPFPADKGVWGGSWAPSRVQSRASAANAFSSVTQRFGQKENVILLRWNSAEHFWGEHFGGGDPVISLPLNTALTVITECTPVTYSTQVC